MQIEIVSNGWVISTNYGKTVHTSIEDALETIYRSLYRDRHVGDRIVIQRGAEAKGGG